MLKFLFGEAFARPAGGGNIVNLASELAPVIGGSGRGKVDYAAGRDGARRIEIELRGMSGSSAEIILNGERIATAILEKGRANIFLDTHEGQAPPDATPGARIEVRQKGELILGGVLLQV